MVYCAEPIWQIALLNGVDRLLDYAPLAGWEGPPPLHRRVRVPLGKRSAIGWVTGTAAHSAVASGHLRACQEVLDTAPLLDPTTLELIHWVAHYYHYPLGWVVATSLPTLLRQGSPATLPQTPYWNLTEMGRTLDRQRIRGSQLPALLTLFDSHPLGLSSIQIETALPGGLRILRRACDRGWIQPVPRPVGPMIDPVFGQSPHAMNPDQKAAVDALRTAEGFTPTVLEGVTGSGKTEVYLQALAAVLQAGRQALVLTPEIGLIPQLRHRLQARFSIPMALLHSGMTERQRLNAWLAARSGSARIVLGTRSAIFTPLPELGLIVIDEEHDAAYKQDEGLRYSARDLALWRARQNKLPIVLGSATPSLESLLRVERGAYRLLRLPLRAGNGPEPRTQLIDMRPHAAANGLSPTLMQAIERELTQGGQVMLFQNRRGYAPMLRCRACGWIAGCPHCDARMTLHRETGRSDQLVCHHCGYHRVSPMQCPDCAHPTLDCMGMGTVRVEESLRAFFPKAHLARIDRDSTRRQGSLERILEEAMRGEANLLIGTQMLAKGHHLPHLGLVAILDVDQGLYSPDFRASERMGQLIMQVAGRAGRELRAGTILIQTHRPDHPWLHQLLTEGYPAFARTLLEERRQAQWPPFTRLALLRAQAPQLQLAMDFLAQVPALLGSPPEVQVLGPVPAPMARRAGAHRAQLLLIAPSPAPLHAYLNRLMPLLGTLPENRRVRWSLDVDPQELF